MARYAVISGNIVENVIEASPGFTISGKTLIQSDIAGPGWTYENSEFSPPTPPEPSDPAYPSATILKSPDGTLFRITVEDDGTLATEPVT